MINGLQFVIRHVRDVAAVRAFYTEKLGFAVVTDLPGFVQFTAPNGANFAIASDTDDPFEQPIELWWYVDNADATYAELKAKDVEIVYPPKDEPFGRAFAIKDTAGDTCYLLQTPR
jgi:catechol 2,3-dioxygenase-like lactoylglutathione lyase family enzyme